MKKQKISTILGNINIHQIGQGPAMVFWSSLMMKGLMWKKQAKYFCEKYHVILIDSPGHGESDPLDRLFTMNDCAESLLQILKALDIEECVLVGNSWGGMMGAVFAALHPEKIRAAVLMNCTASEASTLQKIEYRTIIPLIRHLKTYPDSLVKQSVKAFVGKTTENTKPEVVEYIKKTIKSVNPQSVSWAIESVVPLRIDQHKLLASIKKPVLVIAGEEDRTFSIAETQAMANAIPNAIFKQLPNVGHLAALESPDIINKEIEYFLTTIP